MIQRRHAILLPLRWAWRVATPGKAVAFAFLTIALAAVAQVPAPQTQSRTFEIGVNLAAAIAAMLAFLTTTTFSVLSYLKARDAEAAAKRNNAQLGELKISVDGKMTALLAATEAVARTAGAEDEVKRRLAEKGARAEIIQDLVEPAVAGHSKEKP